MPQNKPRRLRQTPQTRAAAIQDIAKNIRWRVEYPTLPADVDPNDPDAPPMKPVHVAYIEGDEGAASESIGFRVEAMLPDRARDDLARGARGHSALRAAIDTVIRPARDDDGGSVLGTDHLWRAR